MTNTDLVEIRHGLWPFSLFSATVVFCGRKIGGIYTWKFATFMPNHHASFLGIERFTLEDVDRVRFALTLMLALATDDERKALEGGFK